MHPSDEGSIPSASTTFPSGFNGFQLIALWFLSQLAAGTYASHQGWSFLQTFAYGYGGIFSLATSFIRYVFGLLI